MGSNKWQKKKNRSSLPTIRQRQKSKKKVLSNPIIAANWNQKETLSQNYHRLGLTAKLNHATGGIDKTKSLGSSERINGTDHLAIDSHIPTTTGLEEVRIERDPKTGAILRVIEAPTKPNPLNDPLNELEDSDPEEWEGFDNIGTASSYSTSVLRQLEEKAASGVRKPPRKQSAREEEWIEQLVAKHGDNYGAMFRDTKLNVMQQSEGDIRKRVQRWQKSRG
ncbi:60S ribosomal subunit biogenesis protein-like protein Nop16 [Patellaria atrata CBS 101060]|uniref:Nucleolar protein 16 n=1 Tax=Patellaria atrata CBS 101060 TaxID=1346257 RepID=A0A9P4VLD1_9PEZI|nr:60S ribosomal subunit biogenesis protein-like protein Nop16 [Patellaria atrata CBS 101060]